MAETQDAVRNLTASVGLLGALCHQVVVTTEPPLSVTSHLQPQLQVPSSA